MGSINFNWFSENWFQKPQNPITPINFTPNLNSQFHLPKPPNFAFISGSNLFKRKIPKPTEESEQKPHPLKSMLDQYFWECKNLPDHRHTPEVEKILNDSPFEEKENPTPEEIKENAEWWEGFNNSPVVNFLKRAEEVADMFNEMELEENKHPYMWEDRKVWKEVPHVPGPDGRPMPRKSIKTSKESDDKFWDFVKEHYFGLWGFKQRPYPRGRPNDVAQAIGYKQLEKRYYDFIMRSGGFWYKDRLGRTRGPMELIQLKTAWGGGIIDKNTFIWGEDLDEWVPIHMIYGMEKAIATWEVRLGAAATAFIHKLKKGIPPWVPVKGHEKKTYKQLQQEAIESKRRDLAVLEANGGIWPGVRTPSHALFLWASGSELTTIMEADHMPNKFIPKDMRIQLAKAIPGLRPWEVLSIEQAMDRITYGGRWFREPLSFWTTGPPYLEEWNFYVMDIMDKLVKYSEMAYKHMDKTIPAFKTWMDIVADRFNENIRIKEERKAARERAEEELSMYGRRISK